MDIFSKKRLTTWTIIILVIMNLTALALVFFTMARKPLHLPPPSKTGDAESVRFFLKDELDFSEEQVLLFQKSAENHHKQSDAIRKDIHQIKREIIEELFVPQPDEEKVSSIAENIGEKEAQLQKLLFSHFNDVQSILNQEQKEKFRVVIHDLLESIRPQGSQKAPGDRPPPKKKPPRK